MKSGQIETLFHRQIERYQDELLEAGKEFIATWLSGFKDEKEYRAAIDWLLGDESSRIFKANKTRFAYQIVTYAIEKFFEAEQESEAVSAADSDDAKDDFYERVENWFFST